MTRKFLSTGEAAAKLSVSPSTIRNWVRLGRIADAHQADGRYWCAAEEIDRLAYRIQNGGTVLSQRRNKLGVQGRTVPKGYVARADCEALVRTIVERVEASDAAGVPMVLVLLEVSLYLLTQRGLLPDGPLEGTSLVDRWLPCVDSLPWGQLLRPLIRDEPLTRESSDCLRDVQQLLQTQRGICAWDREDDLLGLLYMSLSLQRQRKRTGAYYTPASLVRRLTADAFSQTPVRLPMCCDPCCGSGNFLLAAYRELRERGANPRAALQSLRGQDIDAIACALARIHLLLAVGEPVEPSLLETVVRVDDSLSATEIKAADIVIGNPPWGHAYAPDERVQLRSRYKLAGSACESFALFIERGLELLRPRGILAYVLPEAVTHVESHAPVRRVLYETQTVLQCSLHARPFDDANIDVVTLIVRRAPAAPGHRLQLQTGSGRRSVSQMQWASAPAGVLNPHLTAQQEDIVHRMSELTPVVFLHENARWAMGIVTGSNHEHLLRHPSPGAEPVVPGTAVFRLRRPALGGPDQRYLVFDPDVLQQTAPEELYRREKLVYRFINRHLVVAYDDVGHLTLNSANSVIPEIPGLSCRYVLAVLNSRAVQFYWTSVFQSVKVLRSQLETVPIPMLSTGEHDEITALVDALLDEPSGRTQLYEELDKRIMSLFRLDANSQQCIYNKLNYVRYL